MQISPKALLQIIPYPQLSAKINLGAAVKLTRRHYCSQMNVHNLCTKNCANCAASILAALENIEKAANPVSMYAGRLRQEMANVAENQSKPQPKDDIKTGKYGLAVERVDAFEDLLAEVS